MTDDTVLGDRMSGAVWGHLVGDAAGVPYEFVPGPIRNVRWGHVGTHHQPPGTWSDDGGLMLALLDSLLDVGFDLDDQARRAVAWMDGPDYKPGPRFDIGIATSRALHRVKRGVAAVSAGGCDEGDNGNGSLMRILPVALVGRDLPAAELAAAACRASRVTHGHGRSQVTCAVYCLLVQAILAGERDLDAALESALSTAGASLDPDLRAELALLRGYGSRSGTGYVLDCFWSAWEAFRSAASYQETVERAIGFGSDTDTTAAVAGALAGAFRGIGAIPPVWLDGMRGREIAQPLIDRLIKGSGRPRPTAPAWR